MNPRGNAQNENLRFEHIGIEEGLSNENVTQIFQDSKGYIWFGTFDGLNKYDGYSFTKYRLDPFDSNSISQNFIYTIWEDKYGAIWVSSFEGLCKFDKATEKFTRYKPSGNAKFSDPNIAVINEDSDGMIWVGSHSGGLCRFDRKTGKFLPEYFDLGYSRQLPDDKAGLKDDVHCIYKDRAGTLWVGNTTGLHKIILTDVKAGQLSRVTFEDYKHDPANSNTLSSNIVTSIIEDGAGIIWVATQNGLNSFDQKTGVFKRYLHDPNNIHSISSNNMELWFGRHLKEDQEGNLWVCTDKGLNKLNKDRTIFTHYFYDAADAYSLSSDHIMSLQIDQAGILWAGSWSGKLNKANLNQKGFGIKRHDPNNINSLSSNKVTAILEDSSGIIWIGTYGGGLNRWDKKTNRFTHFRSDPFDPKTLKNDAVHAILEDRQGDLWITNGDVLSQLNKQTGEFTHYHANEGYYKEEDHRLIYSITEDREGLLWLGTGNGIKSFNKKTAAFKHYYHDPADTNGISDYTALVVFADSRDNIWVGHGSKAIDKLNKRTGQFTHYKHDRRDSGSISSNYVNSIYEDSKGNLWFGTSAGGLCYFDYQKEKFKTFTDKHGLPNNTVYSILEDANNNLWLGTGYGLSRFDPVKKTFTNYDYKDGLQGNFFAAGDERERGACFKGGDGILYFGGNYGFNFFDPLQLKSNTQVAPIVITQFKLFDKLQKGANELKEIVLDHEENYFSFEFASLSYYNPVKNQYAYKLEGVDKDWIYSGSRRYAAYTNIDPGTYTFRVKGTNNDGVWNEKGTFISITINPPWWRTWWAYTLFALLFAVFIYSLFRYRLNKIRMQHEIVLQQHKASQLEIESRQALLYERLRISRELHDDIGSTLGSISIYSEVAKKRTEKNENSDEVLFKIGLVSRELIDKMSDIVWSLNPNNESFEQLQNRIITFATMILTPQNIRYDFNADEKLKELHFTGEQRKNIFLIFKEALHNIVKYAACKTVNITLCVKNNHLIMTIKDDGKGFDATATIGSNGLSKASPLGSMGGTGIKNMHARANAMNAQLSINSKIAEGSTVQLTLNL
jgi:ligand-binding sensor domain-containing protein/signal transduction histidine kinase